MLRITHLDPRPRAHLDFQAVSHGGGIFAGRLPLLLGEVTGLPSGLGGLLCASDLQGVAGDPEQQLSLELVRAAESWARQGLIPPLQALGAVLAGDLFGDPDLLRRGMPGEVGAVWQTYAAAFAWLAAVAGNHDRLPGREELDAVPSVYDLGRGVAELPGLRITGVDGVVGRPDQPFRREEQEYRLALAEALAMEPDLLVLHSAPQRPGKRWPGCAVAAEVLDARRGAAAAAGEVPDTGDGGAPLVVCGHKHWDRPRYSPTGAGPSVLNVDGRVVVLVPPVRRS